MEATLDSRANENDYYETVCNKELNSFELFTFGNFHEKRQS